MSNSFAQKKIAITGGSGYIGSAIIEQLKGNAKEIICISRNKMISRAGVTDLNLNLNNFESWINILSEVDIVIHLSGNTSLYEAQRNPKESYISSIVPITHLIEASKNLSSIPRVIFASTATVYGLKEAQPVSEFASVNPVTIYDEHKLLVEKCLATATKNNIISATSLRLANVYGPSLSESGSKDRGILNKIAKMSIEGKNLKIYGTGKYIRDYIYIDDVVNAFLSASLTESSEFVFNVASGVGTSVKDAFLLTMNEAKKYNKLSTKVTFEDWPYGTSEIEKRNFIGSIKLLKSESKWSPSVPLKVGINKLLEHYVKL